jgi:hypothetical protein
LPSLTRMMCPSSFKRAVCASMPPGNLGFRLPPFFITRQYGVTSFFPSRKSSSAASAAIRTKIPVVIGHVTSTPKSFARLLSNLSYGYKLSFLNFANQSIDIKRSGNQHLSRSKSFHHLRWNINNFRFLLLFQFLSPAHTRFHIQYTHNLFC